MNDADKLAQVLAEHRLSPIDYAYCRCGAELGRNDLKTVSEDIAAHQAAVVLAHLTERAEADKAKNVEEAWCASRWLARIMQEADHA